MENISSDRRFMTADDVAKILQVSKSTSYRIIRKMNDDLKKKGTITIAGKVSAKYFYENTYL